VALFVLAQSTLWSLQLLMFELFLGKSILFGIWIIYQVDCCKMCYTCEGCSVSSIWDQSLRSVLAPFGNLGRQSWYRKSESVLITVLVLVTVRQ
jgi:hypothetical protein